MKLTIYATLKRKQNGSEYYLYSTTLTKADGERQYATVRSPKTVQLPAPNKCPMNVIIEKADSHLKHEYWEDDGKSGYNHILWVNKWTEDTENPFRDTSLDDYI